MNVSNLTTLANRAMANAICPQCGAVYGPGLQVKKSGLMRSRVTCPHCGQAHEVVAHSLQPGAAGGGLGLSWEERNNPIGPEDKPAGSPIRLAVRTDQVMQWVIPPRAASGLTRIGYKMAIVIVAVFVLAPLIGSWTGHLAVNFQNPAMWLLLAGPVIVAFNLRRFLRSEQQAAQSALRISLDRQRLQRVEVMPGEPPTRQEIAMRDVRWVCRRRLPLGTGKSRNARRPTAYIEIVGGQDHEQVIEFGERLSESEQRWLVWELRKGLIRLGNPHVQTGESR